MRGRTEIRHLSGSSALKRVALASALILAALLLGASSAGAENSFCEKTVVHNFEKPFSRMPRVHPPPISGKLPFAPGHTYLTQPQSQILVADEGPHIGYGFRSDPGADRTFMLNWRILGRLTQVNGQGARKKLVDTKEQFVGTVTEAEFNKIALRFLLPAREGLYRLDLSFRKKNGKMLKHFSQYFRVVRPTVSVKLALSTQRIRASETLFLRVENLGTRSVRYGEPFSLETFNGSAWVDASVDLGPWHRPLFKILSGLAGKCQSFSVPSDLSAGLYRIRKKLASPARSVTANFEVLP